ncbi:MAG: helicase-related protein, partial [Treponemataceae bacterium]
LFNLLSLLAPEDFYDINIFNRMLEDNQSLVRLANEMIKPNNKDVILDCLKEAKNSFDSDIQKIEENLDAILKDRERQISTTELLKDKFFYSNWIVRNRKRDVYEEMPIREAQTCSFKLDEFEKEIYSKVTHFLKNKNNGDSIFIFALIARQRQMASCLPAALESWKKNSSATEIMHHLENQVYEDFGIIEENEESLTAENTTPILPAEIISDEIISSEIIEKLYKIDSKYKRLYEAIKTMLQKNKNEKIILFSFFRATILYLHERFLKDSISHEYIMGGMGDEKNDVIERFKTDPNINILISSEVGSEGIDLQFASIEINYDLPWNPMRLEQRIGRIDRIGQKAKKIRICNLTCENTIEDSILERLYNRIEIFTHSIGDIEEILGNTVMDLARSMLDPQLSEKQIQEQADQKITAILTRKRQTNEIEIKAGGLSEFREFVLREINTTYENKRYITPDELLFIIKTFLNARYAGCEIKKAKFPNTLILTLSAEAKSDYLDYIKNNNLLQKTVLGYEKKGILCCFDQKEKERIKNNFYEFIDVNHSLVRWAIDSLKDYPLAKTACDAIKVSLQKIQKPSISKGIYTYYIQKWNVDGIKNIHELHFFIKKLESPTLLQENEAEFVIQVVLEHGETVDIHHITQELLLNAKKSLEITYNAAWDVFENFSLEIKTENKNLIEKQIKYVNKTADFKIDRINEEIQAMELQERDEKIIRMRKGKRDKITYEREAQIYKLESKLEVIPTNEDIAVGILIIEE